MRRIIRVPGILWLVALVPLLAAGCNFVTGQKYQNTRRELQASTEKIQQLENRINEQDETIRELRSQLAELRQGQGGDLDQLVTVDHLTIESSSGGYDREEPTGADGIVLYIQPMDRDGDVIKPAGRLKVTLYDLAETEPRVVGECTYDVGQTRELWYGRLWTHHFTVHCPWSQGRIPRHPEITARVEFTELLTGRTFRVQGVYNVALPAE